MRIICTEYTVDNCVSERENYKKKKQINNCSGNDFLCERGDSIIIRIQQNETHYVRVYT